MNYLKTKVRTAVPPTSYYEITKLQANLVTIAYVTRSVHYESNGVFEQPLNYDRERFGQRRENAAARNGHAV